MTVEQAKYRLAECECRDALYEGFICEGCQVAEQVIDLSNNDKILLPKGVKK